MEAIHQAPGGHAVQMLETLAVEAAMTPEQAGLVATGALQRFHRFSVVDPAGLEAVTRQCRLEVSKEAYWHLVGPMENQRAHYATLPWPDRLNRFGTEMRVYWALLER